MQSVKYKERNDNLIILIGVVASLTLSMCAMVMFRCFETCFIVTYTDVELQVMREPLLGTEFDRLNSEYVFEGFSQCAIDALHSVYPELYTDGYKDDYTLNYEETPVVVWCVEQFGLIDIPDNELTDWYFTCVKLAQYNDYLLIKLLLCTQEYYPDYPTHPDAKPYKQYPYIKPVIAGWG